MAQNLKELRFTFEFTRPTGGVAYTAQDGVNSSTSGTTVIAFVPVGAQDVKQKWLVAGGSYQIKTIKLSKSTSSTTNATFDMYLYTSGVTATQDNQPMSLAYANKHVRIGKTSFTMATADSTTSTCAEATNTDVNLTFIAIPPNAGILETWGGNTWQTSTDCTFYMQLVATAAYTPGSAEKFYGEATIFRIDE